MYFQSTESGTALSLVSLKISVKSIAFTIYGASWKYEDVSRDDLLVGLADAANLLTDFFQQQFLDRRNCFLT